MSLTVRFLGTSASRPTVDRNVSSLAIIREGETLMFDCGEGTQRQMMRYGISFALSRIFFTHMHADHMLGVIGLCRTLALGGRIEPMHLFGPPGADELLRRAIQLGTEKQPFPIEVTELEPGAIIEHDHYSLQTFPVDHRGRSAIGYALIEKERLGRFDPERARALGVPEGPMWGELHRGRSVTLSDGRVVTAESLVGPTRPGRRVVLTGDSRPCDATIAAATNADLLVHEATFSDEEAVRALETGHSTAREAAEVAAKAGAKKLLLTHFSARYTRDATELEKEARAVFRETYIARDGMELEVAFGDVTSD
ncbi:MAG: ribonuclease Z [Gemmatimonadaceae bacterium]|nr:ribonuclease Z [Gemmatimonadaceae bacterium]